MSKTKLLIILLTLSWVNISYAQVYAQSEKPWVIWWWMGSAVNQEDLAKQLNDFSASGIGGVCIVPIYGVKGYEDQFLPFLSNQWFEQLEFTFQKAKELNLGVDITPGTGWPLGGFWVDEFASKKIASKEYLFPGSSLISIGMDTVMNNLGITELISILAYNGKEHYNLTQHIENNTLDHKVAKGDWSIVVYGLAKSYQKVKRAAPGGEGLVLDYFNGNAAQSYFNHIKSAIDSANMQNAPRAYYVDSYEVFQANWTNGFSKKFEEMQGYHPGDYLHLLYDKDNPQRKFFIHDMRETISELLFSGFAQTYTQHCSDNGLLSRYQAHGSPGNLLDLYGLSDIPETESFGCSQFDIPGLQCDPDYEEDRFGRPSPLMMKLASSPAHLLNKKLVSAESATWLGNHFKVSLKSIKPQIDELFISGINHIFYHGITYSPMEEEYPGWLFYASTNFGQSSHFWNELPMLNEYIAKCQQKLQQSKPDNNILLYFPANDFWMQEDKQILLRFDIHGYKKWFSNSGLGKCALKLWENGYAFDYVSEKQLDLLHVNNKGQLLSPSKNLYDIIVVPKINYITKESLQNLAELAKIGAKIVFEDAICETQAGLMTYINKDTSLRKQTNALHTYKNVAITTNVLSSLKEAGIQNEMIKQAGLDFIRKTNHKGTLYFISNPGNKFYEDSIYLTADYNYIELSYPLSGQSGMFETNHKFFLQLAPGKSCFLQTHNENPNIDKWQAKKNIDSILLPNQWDVKFISGNIEGLKENYQITELTSWTEWGDENLKYFCGKAKYTTTFQLPEYNSKSPSRYKLVFDDIHETAAIIINGQYMGTIWCLPFMINLSSGVLKKENTIEIVAQNLSANRMIKVDSIRPEWKKFYDINFVDITYKPFDASNWELVPSGLIGKVYLVKTYNIN
jgi:hypothetical protein